MFRRNKKEEFTWRWSFGGRIVNTDFAGYEVLRNVHKEMFDQKIKIQLLEEELKAIKPILESPNYQPPKSSDCSNCDFVVFSPFDKSRLSAVARIACAMILSLRRSN